MMRQIELWIVTLSLILISIGCHNADRYVLTSNTSVTVDQLFLLTVQGDSTQRADGFSRVSLVAQVMDVSEGGRTILFTTTAGVLRIGERTSTDSLLVKTDTSGKVEIELVSPSQPAVAQVIASIDSLAPALTQQLNIRFTAITAEDILSFEALPDEIVVGTTTRTEISVRVDPNLEGEDRRITFSTNIGRFLFGTGDNAQTRSVLADPSGVATVTLENPNVGGEAVITAEGRGFTIEETIRFFVEHSLTFIEPPTSAPADGSALTQFDVVIASESERGNNFNVEFVTTAGTLVSADQEGQRLFIEASNQDTVGLFLRSPRQVGAAQITASLEDGPSDERFITFDLAPPDSVILTIDPDKFQLRPTDQTTLQASLVRAPGRGHVTEGLSVSFFAADSLNNAIPLARFFNVTLADSNGIATAIFTPDGSDYRGLVTITATYFDARATVSGTANVRIIDE
ncbi:MAG: hypothetical protein HOE48_23575 [Candidatus Latescibacteria bacterium]|jgi:hypothetical protein|nr:hypothetical protein [Candidatus Latescibacterota bacterium]